MGEHNNNPPQHVKSPLCKNVLSSDEHSQIANVHFAFQLGNIQGWLDKGLSVEKWRMK